MSTVPVDHHHRSLEALMDPSNPFSLRKALDWVFPLVTPALGKVDLVDVRFHDRGWWDAKATRPRWIRPLLLTIESGTRTAAADISLPWLCDDDALRSTYREPDIRLGGHRGLYLGRPLHPRAQLVARPGLQATVGEGSTVLTLVPDVGLPVSFERRPRSTLVRFGRRPPVSVPLDAAAVIRDGRSVEDMVASTSDAGERAALRRLAAIAVDGGALTRRFAPETMARIDAELGLTDPTWAERLVALVDELNRRADSGSDPRLADELGESALQLRLYGDTLRRTVVAGVVRGLRRHLQAEAELAQATSRRGTDSSTRPVHLLRRVAVRLEDGVEVALDRAIRPGIAGGVVVPDDDRGTLASVESRRAVTRYGPGGIARLGANRLWLRGIHPSRRGQLCPLLTPESEDLGLLRAFALGARVEGDRMTPGERTDRFGDLSVAAGLIPFVNHDDPTRASIAARMLRQVVPIEGASRPRVETPVADAVAEAHGVVRAPVAARVADVGEDWALLRADHGGEILVGFGPARPALSSVNGRWRIVVGQGSRVYPGDILAHAPDVLVEDGRAHIAQGRDCLVAYTPWHGWNFEDAIVVSESILDAFASEHVQRFEEPVNAQGGEVAHLLLEEGRAVTAGEVLAEVTRGGRVLRRVVADSPGFVTTLRAGGPALIVELLTRRPLVVGDKLTNRHGAKGVVSAVLPADEMPRLPDGRHVEMLLNPVGVIRRLNLSQLFETHVTLLADLVSDTRMQLVDRSIASLDELCAALVSAGAPGGRLPLEVDGRALGSPQGVVVGWQHIVKLDHLAANKLRYRGWGVRSRLTEQPTKGASWVAGRLVGGAQRLGEMELWALQAVGADQVVDDAMTRSDQAHRSLYAVSTLLLAAGLALRVEENGVAAVPLTAAEHGLPPLPEDVVRAIVDPRTYGLSNSLARDPLHDYHHGGGLVRATCPCGTTEGVGKVCSVCRSRTVRRGGADRSTCRYRIELAVPIRHPWFEDGSVVLESLPLLPPAYRPPDRNGLDIAYRILVTISERIRSVGNTGSSAEHQLASAVERVLGRLGDPDGVDSIAARLNGKRGLLRRSLRGRDTDLAGRGVVVPDPTMGLEEVGVPFTVLDAFQLADVAGEHADVVLVNRQPTLLPTNLVALRARPVPGWAFRIHPFLCARLAGDFDGDEITVHRPVTDAARVDAWARLRPAASFRHPATGRPVAKVDLDVALGLFLLGRSTDARRELAGKLGLPDCHSLATGDGPVTPAELARVLEDCAPVGVDGTTALGRFAELFRAGVDAATGWTFSAVELRPVELAGDAEDLEEDDLEEIVCGAVGSDTPLGEALGAGVAGKKKGIVQLLARRGALEGFDGAQTPSVNVGFLVGLGDQAFYDTAPGGLRALSDKKLVTPLAGGLTKALVEAVYDVTVGGDDCGSGRVGFGAVLTCALPRDGICGRCYAAAGGDPPALGDRVGLRAAFAIGEGSTQKAMKAFQGGTTQGIGSRVSTVAALFGRGAVSVPLPEGEVTTASLQRLLAARPGAVDRLWLFAELRAQLDNVLEDSVPSCHYEVVWRRLLTVLPSARSGALLDDAQRTGSPLIDATARGRLDLLLSPTVCAPHASPLRMKVIGHLSSAGAPCR
jgi:hypothetical protein